MIPEFIKTHVAETTAAAVATAIIALCSAMLIVQHREINSLKTSISKSEQLSDQLSKCKTEKEQLNDQLSKCTNNITKSKGTLDSIKLSVDGISNSHSHIIKMYEDRNMSRAAWYEAMYNFTSSVCSHCSELKGIDIKPNLDNIDKLDNDSCKWSFSLSKNGTIINDDKTINSFNNIIKNNKLQDVQDNLKKLSSAFSKLNTDDRNYRQANDKFSHTIDELSENLSTVTSNLSDLL